MNQLTIVGLGPGSPDHLTGAAVKHLRSAAHIYTVATEHPALTEFQTKGSQVIQLVMSQEPFAMSDVSTEQTVKYLLLACQSVDCVFAVPGDPLEDDPLVPILLERAQSASTRIQVVPGLSFVATAMIALGFNPIARGAQQARPKSLILNVEPDLFRGIYRLLDPTRPLFIGPFAGAAEYRSVSSTLQAEYPSDHPVVLISLPSNGDPARSVRSIVGDLGHELPPTFRSYMYLEPVDQLVDTSSFDTLRYIVGRLRDPNGCPWDREQDYQSLKKHLIEETYEAIAALDQSDFAALRSELGDVLLQVVMYAQLGREGHDFDLEDVLRSINEKLIRRHPHVFANLAVDGSAEVLRNWEKIKRNERIAGVSPFSGIPLAAPALSRADALFARAERYGLPALDVDASLISMDDIKRSEQPGEVLGAALLQLVGCARTVGADPEEALRIATNHLRDAYESVLATATADGVDFASRPVEARVSAIRNALLAHRFGHFKDSTNS